MSSNNVEEQDDTHELIHKEKQFLKDKESNFEDDEPENKEDDKSIDDSYLIELLGRLNMIKNELDYNRATNYIWLFLATGMVIIIQCLYNYFVVFIAMAFIAEIGLVFNIVFILIPLYGKLFIV